MGKQDQNDLKVGDLIKFRNPYSCSEHPTARERIHTIMPPLCSVRMSWRGRVVTVALRLDEVKKVQER